MNIALALSLYCGDSITPTANALGVSHQHQCGMMRPSHSPKPTLNGRSSVCRPRPCLDITVLNARPLLACGQLKWLCPHPRQL